MYLLAAAPARQAPGPSRGNRADRDKRGRRSGGWNDEDDDDHECDNHNEDRNADRSRQCLTRKSPPGDPDCDVPYTASCIGSSFVVENNDLPADSSSSQSFTLTMRTLMLASDLYGSCPDPRPRSPVPLVDANIDANNLQVYHHG